MWSAESWIFVLVMAGVLFGTGFFIGGYVALWYRDREDTA